MLATGAEVNTWCVETSVPRPPAYTQTRPLVSPTSCCPPSCSTALTQPPGNIQPPVLTPSSLV